MSDEDYGADLPQDRLGSHSSAGDNVNDDSDEEEEGGFYVPTAIMAKVSSAEKPKT